MPFKEVKLSYKKTRSAKEADSQVDFTKSINRISELNVGITAIKKQALQEMLPQMPQEEKRFYEVIISKVNTAAKKNNTKAPKNTQRVNNNVKKLLKTVVEERKIKNDNNKYEKKKKIKTLPDTEKKSQQEKVSDRSDKNTRNERKITERKLTKKYNTKNVKEHTKKTQSK